MRYEIFVSGCIFEKKLVYYCHILLTTPRNVVLASFVLEISVTSRELDMGVNLTIGPQTKDHALFLTSKSGYCAFKPNLVENHKLLHDTVREGESVGGNKKLLQSDIFATDDLRITTATECFNVTTKDEAYPTTG